MSGDCPGDYASPDLVRQIGNLVTSAESSSLYHLRSTSESPFHFDNFQLHPNHNRTCIPIDPWFNPPYHNSIGPVDPVAAGGELIRRIPLLQHPLLGSRHSCAKLTEKPIWLPVRPAKNILSLTHQFSVNSVVCVQEHRHHASHLFYAHHSRPNRLPG